MANFNLKTPNFETTRYIDNNKLLSHLRYLALKDFYIECYKILKESKNNIDNIFKALKDLIESSNTKKEPAEKNLRELETNIDSIVKICDIRDKFYAHLDVDYKNYIYSAPSLPNILNCFIAIENAIITLTSLETLQSYLDELPSKEEFSFKSFS